MFIPKSKIKIIHNLFTASNKPNLTNILYQDKEMSKISRKIKKSLIRSKYNSNTVKTEESYCPYYTPMTNYNNNYNNYNYNDYNEYINYNDYNYNLNTISYDTNYNNSYYNCPLRREIIMKNPEDIINSGILKGPIKKEIVQIVPSINANINEIKNEENKSQRINYIKYPTEERVEEPKEKEEKQSEVNENDDELEGEKLEDYAHSILSERNQENKDNNENKEKALSEGLSFDSNKEIDNAIDNKD